MADLRNVEYACLCGECREHFNVTVALDARYDTVALYHCPMCGGRLEYTRSVVPPSCDLVMKGGN